MLEDQKFKTFIKNNYIVSKGKFYMKGDFEKRCKIPISEIQKNFLKNQ